MAKTIELYNTPAFYEEYLKNWLAHEKKNPKKNAAQLAVISDLIQLVKVAKEAMEPKPTESAEIKS